MLQAITNPVATIQRVVVRREVNVLAIILVVGFVLSIIIVGPVVVVTGPA